MRKKDKDFLRHFANCILHKFINAPFFGYDEIGIFIDEFLKNEKELQERLKKMEFYKARNNERI
jgi:hypothetical protein